MSLAVLAVSLLLVTQDWVNADPPSTKPVLDDTGRQLIPGGFVVIESVDYTPEDYLRMVRMGASFQVIRVPLGKVGGWRNTTVDEQYLKRFDTLVRLGKAAGLRTIFKLVVYGIRPFGEEQWDALWRNTGGSQETLAAAWRRIWVRYQDEPSVFGYDLLNEPQRGFDRDYERCQRDYLLPLLRRLTDALHKISPSKWALYQPLLRKPEDQWAPGKNPVVAIREPFGREHIIYAPHLYQMDLSVIGPMLEDFEVQADLSHAPLFLGEWGSPTRATTDGDPAEQARYTKVYQATVNALDARGIGGIKAWFCGARKPIPVRGSTNWMTWAIFSDRSPAGRIERDYITDVIVRPRPLAVAGRLENYGTDFATMRFEMALRPDPTLGATDLFVPADRHYPTGFQLEIGTGLTMALDPGATTLRTVRVNTPADRIQADQVRWDGQRQQLTLEQWKGNPTRVSLKVYPSP